MAEERLILLKNIRTPGYTGDLKAYRAAGGYTALPKALALKQEQVVDLVKASGLRGRGGAGFPTGLKWSFMPKKTEKPSGLRQGAPDGGERRRAGASDRRAGGTSGGRQAQAAGAGSAPTIPSRDRQSRHETKRGHGRRATDPVEEPPRYLICNADESEPGTFKDHLLMMRDPHQFIEGMIIGCYAVDCRHGYIYVRGESQYAIRHLQGAIDAAHKAHLLGKHVAGTDFELDLTIHPGAGAYICGEETALLDSLEGKRGQPRFKPPFPAVAGYNGCPTSVNNVETLTCLPWIVLNGAEAFKAIGTPNNSGTHLVSISGHVNKPGVYEIEMGVPLRSIIEDFAGGVRNGKKLKAVIPGGCSANILKASEVDLPYDFDSLAKAGTMMGSSAIMVFDEDTDMVEVAYRTIKFFNHESCGQCTPCREGTNWLKSMIRDFMDGAGSADLMQRVERVAGNLLGTTICAFGDATGGPMRTFVQKFPEDFRRRMAMAKAS